MPKKMLIGKDSFVNALSNMGECTDNIINHTQYTIFRYTRDYHTLNALYRNNWIIKKIVNTVADDMTKNWIKFNADIVDEQQERLSTLFRRTKTKTKISEALYWSRLYGGSGALMLIEGEGNNLIEPLDLNRIMPNAYKGLFVLDRWSGIYPSIELISDINDPDFGLPEYYYIRNLENTSMVQTKVHHSRLLLFRNRKLSSWEEQGEMYWGASELDHIIEELKKRDNTSWNIATLVFQANLLVNKVDGMDILASLGDTNAQSDLYNLKSAIAKMRSASSVLVCGQNEDYSNLQYSFSGLAEIYKTFMLDISGAAEIPATKLFGRSPEGMNATGDMDMQNYYEKIKMEQEKALAENLDKLLPIIFMSEFGTVDNALNYEFEPVYVPSESEQADLIGKKTAAVSLAYQDGALSIKKYLMELQKMAKQHNMFTTITDEDIAKAPDELMATSEITPELDLSKEVSL